MLLVLCATQTSAHILPVASGVVPAKRVCCLAGGAVPSRLALGVCREFPTPESRASLRTPLLAPEVVFAGCSWHAERSTAVVTPRRTAGRALVLLNVAS